MAGLPKTRFTEITRFELEQEITEFTEGSIHQLHQRIAAPDFRNDLKI